MKTTIHLCKECFNMPSLAEMSEPNYDPSIQRDEWYPDLADTEECDDCGQITSCIECDDDRY